MELEIGVIQIERRDSLQANVLRNWLRTRIEPVFDRRILPFGAHTAQICASLHAPDPRPERDAMIAATALEHQLTVVTRNVADFAPMGVSILNPWQA
jgi:predicted nucleic acid-binding protein